MSSAVFFVFIVAFIFIVLFVIIEEDEKRKKVVKETDDSLNILKNYVDETQAEAYMNDYNTRYADFIKKRDEEMAKMEANTIYVTKENAETYLNRSIELIHQTSEFLEIVAGEVIDTIEIEGITYLEIEFENSSRDNILIERFVKDGFGVRLTEDWQ